MQVQVNGRYQVQQVTGQQRYAREIVARLADRMHVVRPQGKPKGIRGHLWEQMSLPRGIDSDLLWSPSTTGPLSVSKQVVTIHDCAFFDTPDCFSRAFARWYQFLIPRLARRVRQVITVSEYSKQQIIRWCQVPESKVSVVYSGVDPRFRPHSPEEIVTARQQLHLPQRYLLCVGSLEPRKNLRRLLEAWRTVQPRHEGLSLVLVGARGNVFRDAGLTELPPDTHLTGYLDDELLPAVYAGAESFVYPSIYEGFGLPAIEAMASGTPVLTSNVTSLPEVAGDAALQVDPHDVASIADGIDRLASDPLLRQQMCELGSQHASQFRWEDTAEATWQVLQAAR